MVASNDNGVRLVVRLVLGEQVGEVATGGDINARVQLLDTWESRLSAL